MEDKQPQPEQFIIPPMLRQLIGDMRLELFGREQELAVAQTNVQKLSQLLADNNTEIGKLKLEIASLKGKKK